MPMLQLTPESRVTLDPESGAIRTWFDIPSTRLSPSPFEPREFARQILEERANLFKWWPDFTNLRDHAVIKGEKSLSVRFTQAFKGIPVDSSDVVVNMYDDGRIYSIYNNYHYDIPEELDPQKVVVNARQAKQRVEQLLSIYPQYEVSEPTLLVYQYRPADNLPPRSFATSTEHRQIVLAAVADENQAEAPYEAGQYCLAWEMVATTQNPRHAWRILVDAMTNCVINVIDLLQYITSTTPIIDENPIDRFQHYIETDLGLANVANFPVSVDLPDEVEAGCSHYNPTSKHLVLAEESISDAYAILHEYGHAIQDNVNPGFGNGSYSGGTSEGFGEFLASTYYDDKYTDSPGALNTPFSWDANRRDIFGLGRQQDSDWLFDSPEFANANGHGRAQVWSGALFELYRKLGGDSAYAGVKRAAKDLSIRLHLMANFNVPSSGATAAHMAQQIEAADSHLGGWCYADGLHRKVIYDTFRKRHLAGYPDKAVDVYINDGREGGYGSASGHDLFSENLWQENYWDTQDIWVRTTPYANALAQAAGSSDDHVEPPIGSTAYLYVRVKNRGTNASGSGQVTVKAFHSASGVGLVWPDAWKVMDTPSMTVSNILPGRDNGVVVGPFLWTPDTVGHESLLVIAECANDRALTQNLRPTDYVPHSYLVPFDNNIAQRNLMPVAAQGSSVHGFYVSNPYPEVQTIALHFASSLPENWSWRTNLVVDQIRLGPLERRWVELVINQAGGEAVTAFDESQRLTVTGTIDDRVMGGMTFYLAPPSAFSQTIKPESTPSNTLCLNIPWSQLGVEGELEIKIRFHKKP